MRKSSWLSLAATMVIGASAALAAPGPADMGPPGMGPGGMGMLDGGAALIGVPSPRMLDRLAADLGLTADQQQKIRGVFESARPEMEQVRDRSRENAEKLRAAQPGSAGYDAVVSEVARNAGELASRAVTNGAQLRAQVWAVLTPDQRQKLETLQAQRRTAMKERMEKRRAMRSERR
jgi:Spy/CpxP family protein refolding chaperone